MLSSPRASEQEKQTTNHEMRLLPQGRHRHDGVPKRCWYGGEFRIHDTLLRVVHHRGKDNDRHGQGKEEKAQFTGTTFQRVTQHSQALTVPREFEDTKNTKDAQRDECPADFAFVWHE